MSLYNNFCQIVWLLIMGSVCTLILLLYINIETNTPHDKTKKMSG